MKWIKAEHKDLVNMGSKHWRDAKTKTPISAGTAFTWVRDGRNEVEWLDETAGEQQPGEERYGYWQCCPCCGGFGYMQEGRVEGNNIVNDCPVCAGAKIIQRPSQPPAGDKRC